jgi:hypothetical protein
VAETLTSISYNRRIDLSITQIKPPSPHFRIRYDTKPQERHDTQSDCVVNLTPRSASLS